LEHPKGRKTILARNSLYHTGFGRRIGSSDETLRSLVIQKLTLIGGKWVEGQTGRTFPTICPRNGECISTLSEARKEDTI
jgi:hypothetical protein